MLNSVYFNGITVGAKETNLFTCDSSSDKKIADGLILKLGNLDIKNTEKLKEQVTAKKSLASWFELSSLENDSDLDNEYKFISNRTEKRLKNLKKYKKIKHKLGIDRTYLVKAKYHENETYSCAELKSMEKQILSLLAEDFIEYLEPNYIRDLLAPIALNQELANTLSSLNTGAWAINKIKAKSAWLHSTGKGVTVAMLDSGMEYNHPNLWDKVWVDDEVIGDVNADGFVNLDDADIDGNRYIDSNFSVNEITTFNSDSIFGEYYKDAVHSNPLDGFGHGTHVAGIIAAEDSNNPDYNGIAYDSKLIAMKIFDNQGNFSSISELLKAIRSAIIDGAKVINASIGGSFYSHLEEETYRLAEDLGVLVVAAAGNNGSNNDFSPIYPANYRTVFSVASTSQDDSISNFSNYGNSVDIAAPGDLISSTMANDSYLASNFASSLDQSIDSDYGYWYLSGTSMATPYVAGLAALILSKHPELSNDAIRNIIKESSDPVIGTKNIANGRINALRALEIADEYSSENSMSLKELSRTLFLSRPRSKNISKFNFLSLSSSMESYSQSAEGLDTLAKVIRALNAVDTNRNGIVTAKELSKYKAKFKRRRRFPFRRLDVNKDGKVNEIDDIYIKYIYSLIDITV
ncbi:MAG: S8 family serine peptidase [Candidatus Caenarcaniphilales bacterium]|nr:S8 family serine peptidase [Candidatus Caenarcaniphilales bacterium]